MEDMLSCLSSLFLLLEDILLLSEELFSSPATFLLLHQCHLLLAQLCILPTCFQITDCVGDSLPLSFLHFVAQLIVEEGLLLLSMKTSSGKSVTTVPAKSGLASKFRRR